MDLFEQESEEPVLTYWNPTPQSVPTSFHPKLSIPPENVFPGVPTPHPTGYTASPESRYPITHVYDSFVKNQNYQSDTDSMIQTEVTRAAKTLFRKRNKTLMQWMNPTLKNNHLKIDLNAAWDNLPPNEKVFYISQVLNKFVPHTSLMVNPSLKIHKERMLMSSPTRAKTEVKDIRNHTKSSNVENDLNSGEIKKVKRRYNKKQKKIKISDSALREIKSEVISCHKPVDTTYSKEDHESEKFVPREIKREVISCHKPINITNGKEELKMEKVVPREIKSEVFSCHKPVDTTNSKGDHEMRKVVPREIKSEAIPCHKPGDITNSKKRHKTKKVVPREIKGEVIPCHMPGDTTNSKKEPKMENVVPRVKRKYVKRKLVRKKYTRRESKNKSLSNDVTINAVHPLEKPHELPVLSYEDLNLWIEINSNDCPEDFILTNEEVDNFWESFDDPNSLFKEFDIT